MRFALIVYANLILPLKRGLGCEQPATVAMCRIKYLCSTHSSGGRDMNPRLKLLNLAMLAGVFSILNLILATAPASALEIDAVFDSSFASQPNGADMEAAVNTAISIVDQLYENPVTVNVLFQAIDAPTPGSTRPGYVQLTYAQYSGLLTANAAANPQNTTLGYGVQYLGRGNGANPLDVLLTDANARALGLNVPGLFDSNGAPHAGGAKFDAVVQLSPSFNYAPPPSVGLQPNGQILFQQDGLTIIEHELNEVLGGGGAGSWVGRDDGQFPGPHYGSLDPFRYKEDAPSVYTGSFTLGEQAFLTTAPGVSGVDGIWWTSLIGDQGDFSNAIKFGGGECLIQSAELCKVDEFYTSNSPEFVMMNAIGYDPFGSASDGTTPLPSTWVMMLTGLAGLGFIAYRRQKKAAALAAA